MGNFSEIGVRAEKHFGGGPAGLIIQSVDAAITKTALNYVPCGQQANMQAICTKWHS